MIIEELISVVDIIVSKQEHIRRTGKALASKRATVKRLKTQNMTIKEISERMEAPVDTVKEWLYPR